MGGLQTCQPALAIAGMGHLETGLPEVLRHHLGQPGVVLDQQQSFSHGGSVGGRPGRLLVGAVKIRKPAAPPWLASPDGCEQKDRIVP